VGAEARDHGAAPTLGMLFLTGAGVAGNRNEAAHWFRIAAKGTATPCRCIARKRNAFRLAAERDHP